MDGTATVKQLKSSLAPSRRRRAQPKPTLDAVPASTESVPQDEPKDRKSIAIDILVQGYVLSYVDFFYLTHRPDPNPDLVFEGKFDQEIDVPLEDMKLLQHHLTKAEMARREGDTRTVFSSYHSLAQYYQGIRDHKTTIYFYEKALEIAKLTQDKDAEMDATHHLGLAYEVKGDLERSIRFHEKHLSLAQDHSDSPQILAAHKQLTITYEARAAALEQEQKYEQAIVLYLKAMHAAKSCNDKSAEAQANYKAGRAHVLLEQPEKAISYLQNYLKIAQSQSGKEEDQGAAYAALAAAFQAMDKSDDAVKCLEQFLKIAQDTRNQAAQREACTNLGVMHNRQQNYSKAVMYFEQAYDLARHLLTSGSGNRGTVDSCRVNLGMARGNAKMGVYMNVINYDLSKLLNWKTHRAPLTQEGGLALGGQEKGEEEKEATK